jgi:hypothetical protein
MLKLVGKGNVEIQEGATEELHANFDICGHCEYDNAAPWWEIQVDGGWV